MEANNKAMREALEAINCIDTRGLKRLLCELVEADIFDGGLINKTISAIEKARRALSDPPRQCNVGTEREQYHRFCDFCANHKCDISCPVYRGGTFRHTECVMRWAQMPYEDKATKEGVE